MIEADTLHVANKKTFTVTPATEYVSNDCHKRRSMTFFTHWSLKLHKFIFDVAHSELNQVKIVI